MSYILDALKKSEKERQKGAVPNIMSQQESPTPEQKKRSLWPYLLVVALLLNTCLLAWWFGSHQKGPATAQAPVAGASVVPPPEPLKNTVYGAAASAEKPLPEPFSLNVPQRSEKTTPNERSLQAGISGRKGLESIHSKSASAKRPAAASKEAPPVLLPASESQIVPVPVKDKIYSLSELPPPLHQGLPGLTISTHLYAEDAGSRMVWINGQALREGQSLTADLKLEEILPDGVILNFRSYRFRLGLK